MKWVIAGLLGVALLAGCSSETGYRATETTPSADGEPPACVVVVWRKSAWTGSWKEYTQGTYCLDKPGEVASP